MLFGKKHVSCICLGRNMDRIRLHLNGDVEMRTICADNGLVLILMKNEIKEKWFGQTRKVKSFKEIHMIESIKSSFFLYESMYQKNEED